MSKKKTNYSRNPEDEDLDRYCPKCGDVLAISESGYICPSCSNEVGFTEPDPDTDSVNSKHFDS